MAYGLGFGSAWGLSCLSVQHELVPGIYDVKTVEKQEEKWPKKPLTNETCQVTKMVTWSQKATWPQKSSQSASCSSISH